MKSWLNIYVNKLVEQKCRDIFNQWIKLSTEDSSVKNTGVCQLYFLRGPLFFSCTSCSFLLYFLQFSCIEIISLFFPVTITITFSIIVVVINKNQEHNFYPSLCAGICEPGSSWWLRWLWWWRSWSSLRSWRMRSFF